VTSRRLTIYEGALLAASAAIPFGAGASGAEGIWSGILEAGALRLRLKLEIASDGSATLFSLDQGRDPRAGTVKSSASDHVEIEFPAIRASFVARLVTPDRIDGVWRQGGRLLAPDFRAWRGRACAPASASTADQGAPVGSSPRSGKPGHGGSIDPKGIA